MTYLEAKEMPSWMNDPSLNGKYIGAIGCAKESKNEKVQSKIALLRAKGAISQEIETEVEDKAHLESMMDGEDFDEEFSFQSTQSSAASFEIIEMDRYRDKHKNLCIWVVKK